MSTQIQEKRPQNETYIAGTLILDFPDSRTAAVYQNLGSGVVILQFGKDHEVFPLHEFLASTLPWFLVNHLPER